MKWGGCALCLLLLSCDNGPTQPGSAPDVYFQTGRMYRYEWSAVMKDSAGNVLYSETDTVALVVQSSTEKIDTMSNLIKVVITDRANQSTIYYRNTTSALTEVAYEISGTPLVEPSIRRTNGRTFRLAPSLAISTPVLVQWLEGQSVLAGIDSVIVRSDPRVVYRYPLIMGQQWVSFTNPFNETREVVGFENVNVPAGTYNCAVVKTDLDLGSGLDWRDYVNVDGLVKRVLTIQVVFSSVDNPEGTGETGVAIEQATLLSAGNFVPQ